MTYYGFLAVFIGIPLALLSILTIRDFRRGHWMPDPLSNVQPWLGLLLLAGIALVYTTPWDNYLVATRVWWYDPDLVTGIVIWYVPIEEYTFFILQPLLTGLWLITLMRYMPLNPARGGRRSIRKWAVGITGLVWVGSCVLLALALSQPEWKPVTYLSLELSWALIPVMVQFAFGADILWRHRRPVLTAIITSTLYLSLADAGAIYSGTWTIDPEQSLQIYLGGVLPLEELLFFLLTNILIVSGITLLLAEESLERVPVLRPLLQKSRARRAEAA